MTLGMHPRPALPTHHLLSWEEPLSCLTPTPIPFPLPAPLSPRDNTTWAVAEAPSLLPRVAVPWVGSQQAGTPSNRGVRAVLASLREISHCSPVNHRAATSVLWGRSLITVTECVLWTDFHTFCVYNSKYSCYHEVTWFWCWLQYSCENNYSTKMTFQLSLILKQKSFPPPVAVGQ